MNDLASLPAPLRVQWTTQSYDQPWVELREALDGEKWPRLILRVAPKLIFHYPFKPSIENYAGVVSLYNFAEGGLASPFSYDLESHEPQTRVVAELLFGYAPFNIILDAILEHPQCPDLVSPLIRRIVW